MGPSVTSPDGIDVDVEVRSGVSLTTTTLSELGQSTRTGRGGVGRCIDGERLMIRFHHGRASVGSAVASGSVDD